MTSLELHPEIAAVLADSRRRARNTAALAASGAVVIAAAFLYAGAFDLNRYAQAFSTILQLVADALPPDFSRWRNWGRPLLETLSMSIAGTVLGAAAALPLGVLSARTLVHAGWLREPVRVVLNVLRSIPGLIWGVIFVAAVGFGPLPGILALGCQSAGVLGKFFAEILEHADPAPGQALTSQGVSRLGVLRYSVLPQILPRLVDATVYRWEHNLRAATTLGVVGAGGLGLEIITAFHLFEYREASALIIVLVALVTVLNAGGAHVRARFLGDELQSR
jgi:phosphonate transport system permease protein